MLKSKTPHLTGSWPGSTAPQKALPCEKIKCLHTQSKYRLLVVRLGAMGDILHALPAVTALRQAHPGWVIDWVVEPAWMALLSARHGEGSDERNAVQPLVDRVFPAPTKAWGKEPLHPQTTRQISHLRADLRAG